MYVNAQNAMHKRRMLESPSCAALVMQQPDLGRLGRLTGSPIVTLGDVVSIGQPAPAAASPFSISPWLLGGAALLLVGLLWYRRQSAGGSGVIPRGIGKKFTRAATLAGVGAGGYILGKYL